MKLTEFEKLIKDCGQNGGLYENEEVLYEELPKLLTLIRQMKEALEFYANPESYKDQDNSCGDPECCTRFPYFPIEEDGGDNAKDALTALEQYEAVNDGSRTKQRDQICSRAESGERDSHRTLCGCDPATFNYDIMGEEDCLVRRGK